MVGSSARVFRLAFRWLTRQEAIVRLVAFGVILALLVFAKTAGEMLEGDLREFDEGLLRYLRDPNDPRKPIGPPWLVAVATDATALGGTTVLVIVLVIVERGALPRKDARDRVRVPGLDLQGKHQVVGDHHGGEAQRLATRHEGLERLRRRRLAARRQIEPVAHAPEYTPPLVVRAAGRRGVSCEPQSRPGAGAPRREASDPNKPAAGRGALIKNGFRTDRARAPVRGRGSPVPASAPARVVPDRRHGRRLRLGSELARVLEGARRSGLDQHVLAQDLRRPRAADLHEAR